MQKKGSILGQTISAWMFGAANETGRLKYTVNSEKTTTMKIPAQLTPAFFAEVWDKS